MSCWVGKLLELLIVPKAVRSWENPQTYSYGKIYINLSLEFRKNTFRGFYRITRMPTCQFAKELFRPCRLIGHLRLHCWHANMVPTLISVSNSQMNIHENIFLEELVWYLQTKRIKMCIEQVNKAKAPLIWYSNTWNLWRYRCAIQTARVSHKINILLRFPYQKCECQQTF